jgi:serine/threonine-protein kinase
MAVTKIGSYNVLRAMGRGPLGQSYLAEDRHDGRRVVIKLLGAAGDSGAVVERARKVGALSHPGIAVSQVGLHDDEPFIATEYVEGTSLDQWLKEKHSPGDQLRVVAGVADAISHAHEQGVLHMALKPSNVQVQGDGWCKLLDFGLGQDAGKAGGDPAYAAPEVIQGQPYTGKADIYGAGVIFYEVLAGKNPFHRDTPAATASAVQSVQPTPLADLRKDVKRDLSDAIMACLEKDPDWRPKDLSYVLELVRDLPRVAPKPVRAGPRATAVPARAVPTFGARPGAAPPNRLPLILGVLLVVAAGGGVWFWLNGGLGMPTAAPSPRATATPAGLQNPGASAEPEVPPSTAPSPAAMPTTAAPATPAPTPSAPPAATPTPVPTAPPTPTPVAPPTPRLVEVPISTPPPPTTLAPRPPVTPPPDTTPPQTTPAADSSEPTVLRTVNPSSVRRKGIAILDLRGSGFRGDQRAVVFRGREIPSTVAVVRQRLVNSGLMQVGLQVDEAAAPGSYTIGLTDPQGRISNTLKFEVAK